MILESYICIHFFSKFHLFTHQSVASINKSVLYIIFLVKICIINQLYKKKHFNIHNSCHKLDIQIAMRNK